jgi:hypothetical protein
VFGGALKQNVQSVPQQGVVNNLPVALSTWDVVSWIAFRELQPRPDLPDAVDFTLKWGSYDATQTLAALEARSSGAPYCVWEPSALDGEKWDGSTYKHVAASPHGPKMLRSIVSQLKTKHRRIVTFREAAGILQSELEAFRLFNVRTDEAKRELVDALPAGKLTAWGKRDTRRGQPDPSAQHEAILASVFLDELVSVTEWGTVGADPEHPTATFEYHGPAFRDVRFYADDVTRLWPGRTSGKATEGGTQIAPPELAEVQTQIAPHVAVETTPPPIETVETVAPVQPAEAAKQVKLAIPNKPGAGGKKTAAATDAMVQAVKDGSITFEALRRMKQKELVALYPEAKRTTLNKCREAALARLAAGGHADKAPT